jgi:GAF domain-containing protein
MYEELADRLALILENARLLQDAQSQAMREQQINLISTKIRSTIDLEAVLQNTVQELGKTFGSARAFIQLNLDHLPEVSPIQEDDTRGQDEA